MTAKRNPQAYTRVARPSELPAATRLLTRAFAKNPSLNWYGGVRELVGDIDSPTPEAEQSMRYLSWFEGSLVRLTLLERGVVTVVVAPRSRRDIKVEPANDVGVEEDVVGVALWFPPGKSLDIGLSTLIRSGFLSVLWGWGLPGVMRLLFDFNPTIEHILAESFKKHGRDRLDSWHLLALAVDPAFHGQGYSTLLFEDGLTRASPKPIHLETADHTARDIYLHWGFKVDGEHTVGIGEVDRTGVKAHGAPATGYTEWVMTRWRT